MLLLTSERFAHHLTPPGHPERPERADALRRVALAWGAAGHDLREPVPADEATLALVHASEYVEAIRETAGRAVRLDPDTTTSPESYDVARLAVGAVVDGVRHVLAQPHDPAVALVRPPGHHAEPARAMGFCLFNSVAVGAAWARRQGLARVAIVDFDVHHGNGTQAAFYDDPSVLFVSSHQFPYYPGSGAVSDVGTGLGVGATVNLPLEAGAGDADLDEVFRAIAVPVLDSFRPELVLVSAGFDAHRDDPLGGLRMTPAGFANLARLLEGVVHRHAGGRVVYATEGGYDIEGLTMSLDAVLGVLADRRAETPDSSVDGDRTRGRQTVADARHALVAHWPGL
ncbi:MAG: histone deacetylase [Acidobacteria bacterium]|nr:histone deacetylase [Acidobacteriota bacterium]